MQNLTTADQAPDYIRAILRTELSFHMVASWAELVAAMTEMVENYRGDGSGYYTDEESDFLSALSVAKELAELEWTSDEGQEPALAA